MIFFQRDSWLMAFNILEDKNNNKKNTFCNKMEVLIVYATFRRTFFFFFFYLRVTLADRKPWLSTVSLQASAAFGTQRMGGDC